MEKIALRVKEEDQGQRIDAFLSKAQGIRSRSLAQKLIANGSVLVNGALVSKNYSVKAGDEIIVTYFSDGAAPLCESLIELNIKYEDDQLMVISKPAGLTVHPTNDYKEETLVGGLQSQKKSLSKIGAPLRPGVVHRLDKDTSGLIIIAKNDAAHLLLAEAIKDRQVKRSYLTLVLGSLEVDRGRIEAPIGRSLRDRKKMSVTGGNLKDAASNFLVIERFSKHTLLKVDLDTGRTHQIRVHMRFIGHPVVGDKKYGSGSKDQNLGLERQFLHASRLEFNHPLTGKRIIVEDDLPKDLADALSLAEDG